MATKSLFNIETNRRFGVEIECYRDTRSTVLASNDLGDWLRSRGGLWHSTRDGSVWNRKTPYLRGEEQVSNILSGRKGLREIYSFSEWLKEEGFKVDHKCGLHVHVDVSDLTEEQVHNIATFYLAFDRLILGCMPEYRAFKKWCRPIFNNRGVISRFGEYADRSTRLSALKTYGGKYSGINFVPLDSDTGANIEFRYASGTTNKKKIVLWTRICLKIVEKAHKREWNWKRAYAPTERNIKRFGKILGLNKAELEILMSKNESNRKRNTWNVRKDWNGVQLGSWKERYMDGNDYVLTHRRRA